MSSAAPVSLRAFSPVVACAAALALAGAAAAGERPPPDVPAVSAYIETFPTTSGALPARTARRPGAPLASDVERELERAGGADAAELTEIATQTPTSDTDEPSPSTAVEGDGAEAVDASVVSPVESAATDARLVALAVALVLATALLAAAWQRTRRRAR